MDAGLMMLTSLLLLMTGFTPGTGDGCRADDAYLSLAPDDRVHTGYW